MAEQSTRADRPLDALRRATFAHAAHIDLLRAFDGGPEGDASGGTRPTEPSVRAALKPKRKGGKR